MRRTLVLETPMVVPEPRPGATIISFRARKAARSEADRRASMVGVLRVAANRAVCPHAKAILLRKASLCQDMPAHELRGNPPSPVAVEVGSMRLTRLICALVMVSIAIVLTGCVLPDWSAQP